MTKKGSLFLRSCKFELMIFIFLLFQLLTMKPAVEDMHDWCITPYALSYELGLGSRFFIGSILRLLVDIFRGGILTPKVLYYFIFTALILLCALISYVLGAAIRKSKYQLGVGFLVVLFLASPSSVSYLFYWGNYGRLDIFLLIFSLLSLFCIRHKKLKYLVPALSLFAMATQQVYSFTYFPLIVGILLYYLYENKFTKSSFAFVGITLVVVGSAFVYFQFFSSNLKYSSVNGVLQHIEAQNAGFRINPEMIEAEYFQTMSFHWKVYVTPDWEYRLTRGVVILLLMLPLQLIIVKVWRDAIKATEQKSLKIIFRIMMWLPIMALPAFILTIDWGRWFAAYFIVQILLILYLLRAKSIPMEMAMNSLQKFFKKNWFICLLLLIYLASLGKFSAALGLSFADTIAEPIYKILF